MRVIETVKVLSVLAFMLLMAPMAAQAQSDREDWQAAISGQIEALRSGDAPAALGFAGAGFQTRFTDPEEFLAAIVASGYAPIAQSQSHSFGAFNQVGPDAVAQVVRFIGPSQKLYEALYQMRREAAGWRVQGVLLRQQAGLAV